MFPGHTEYLDPCWEGLAEALGRERREWEFDQELALRAEGAARMLASAFNP